MGDICRARAACGSVVQNLELYKTLFSAILPLLSTGDENNNKQTRHPRCQEHTNILITTHGRESGSDGGELGAAVDDLSGEKKQEEEEEGG